VVRQFRDEMKTFMLAGHETSAAMMTWALYELMLKPGKDVLQQLVQESKTVFDPAIDWSKAKEEELPSADKLSKLVLSEACLKVSFRDFQVYVE
jgi:cytochrome P450